MPGAAAALLAPPQSALRTPPARSCGRSVRAGQDAGSSEPAGEVRLLGQGPLPLGWRPGASSLRAPGAEGAVNKRRSEGILAKTITPGGHHLKWEEGARWASLNKALGDP